MSLMSSISRCRVVAASRKAASIRVWVGAVPGSGAAGITLSTEVESSDGGIGPKGPTRGVMTSLGIALAGGVVRRPVCTRPMVVKPLSVPAGVDGKRREMLVFVGVSTWGRSLSGGWGSVARASGGSGFDALALGGGGVEDPARWMEKQRLSLSWAVIMVRVCVFV
jgi:hypothetical protein